MAEEARKQFQVIQEGVAKATFGGLFSGGVIAGAQPLTLAAVEDNGGLDPAEYFVCMARILSAAVTPYRKFDFTREGVLKKATPLFEGLTLYANHTANVNDWKGFIQEPVWDDKNQPNGINAKVVLDRTVDPKLARGVETKALRSFSVTIWFKYERSHPDLANFYDRLGEVIDGQMVRFIVTEITNAGEVSVVWEGEDPFAKSFGAPEGGAPLHQEGETDMKLTVATMTALGIPAGTELTEALIEEKVAGLTSQITTLKPQAALGAQLLTETRERAVTLYKAAKGEKVVESFITNVLEKADLETARAFLQEYQDEVDKIVPLACPKCGEKLSRRSSRETEENLTTSSNKRVEDYKV